LHQVSHELRSPLARLQMAVGLARQQPDKLESSLVRIERESARMDVLVGELLELSRLESGDVQLEKELVNVNELLFSIVEDARFEGMAKQIAIQYQENLKALTLSGQHDLLHRAIDNVIRNALKFSPPQSMIDIRTEILRTELKEHKVVIQVSDQGPGIVESELEHIFQPFFRGSASQQTDGHGIGLAIAKQIIEAHGGMIAVRNLPTKGLLVEITLPLAG
jgi:two-component system OmpR family sensor kinase